MKTLKEINYLLDLYVDSGTAVVSTEELRMWRKELENLSVQVNRTIGYLRRIDTYSAQLQSEALDKARGDV